MTDHPDSATLDSTLISGVAWTAALRWTAQFISWIATFYAARILTPADYGLIAMAMLAVGLARMVQDFGLDSVLVQDRTIVGDSESRLAGFTLCLGVALAAIYVTLATPLARFFDEPELRAVTIGLSVLFLFDAVQVIPFARLQRKLQFRRLAFVHFTQVLATSLALVVSLQFDLSYWALVLSNVAGEFAATAVLLSWEPVQIRWPREIRSLSKPLLQGWRLLASRFAWYGYTNADQTIIGRVLGKEMLGSYSFSLMFSTLSQKEIGAVLSRVVPGIFSEIQQHPESLRRYFLLLTELLATVSFPMAAGIALIADQLVPLALGDQWQNVVTPLRLLCIYSAFMASETLVAHVLLWTGQFRVNMWCSILAVATLPLAFLFAVRFGLEGIAATWALVYPVVSLPQFVFAFRTIRVSPAQWLRSLKPAVVGCAAMSIAVLGTRWNIPADWSLLTATATSVAVGVVTYAATLWFAFRSRVKTVMAIVATRHRLRGP